MFKPYCIELTMRTPIVPGKFPLHLDSLFYWLLSEFIELDDDILRTLDTVIKKEDDTYLCSALYFKKKPKFIRCGITAKSDLMIENLADMDAWSIDGNMGETKMASVHAVAASTAYFNATCNKEKTEALLKKINGVGRLTNSGFGEIVSISFVELDRDESIISDGRLMRVVKNIGLTPDQINRIDGARNIGRHAPPYHSPVKCPVIIPKRLVYTAQLLGSKKKSGYKKGFSK